MRTAAACLLLIVLTGCASFESPQPASAQQTTATVDSRIELMSMIQLLSGYNLVSYLDSDYKKEAAEFFEPCADHPAISKFAALAAKDFNFSIVPEAFIALSQPPDLEQRYPVKEDVVQSAGGTKSYEEFVALARTFATDCRFQDFYLAHHSYYGQLVARARPSIDASTHSLLSYLGMPLDSTEVVLGPLLHDGGFATRYTDDYGDTIAYAFVGPVATVEGQASFGGTERLRPLIAHEFAHTIVNPLTKRFGAEVSASESNFAPLAEAMKREGYGNWEQVVNESIIRALTARLTTIERDEAAGKAEIADELRRGFVYVPALIVSLEYYETHRSLYPTIADYYPHLLRVFKQPVQRLP